MTIIVNNNDNLKISLLATAEIPVNVEWENQTFVFTSNSMSMAFDVCWTVLIDTSVLVGSNALASLGDRNVTLTYSLIASSMTQKHYIIHYYYTLSTWTGSGTTVTTMDFIFFNSTLGRMCVAITNGINTGVIENDQNFTVSLQNAQATSDVEFPSGDTSSVQILERESMSPIINWVKFSAGLYASFMQHSHWQLMMVCWQQWKVKQFRYVSVRPSLSQEHH